MPKKKLYEFYPFNFGALRVQNFEKAKVVILQVPYEGTVSFNPGTSAGPYAIVSSSRYIDELFDCITKGSLSGFKTTDIFTLPEVELSKNSVKEALAGVEQMVFEEAVNKDKFPLTLGGEHSITLPCLRAVKKEYKDVSLLHFDAHTDLLNSHEGTKLSHACVIRRVRELKVPVVSIGIRNMNAETERFIKKKKLKHIYYAPKIPSLEKALKGLSKNVYISFDFDAFDPSIMPSVGTPEPGGLLWDEVIDFIQKISKKVNLVGADVVELRPIPSLDAPDFMAAKLVYKIIECKLNK